MGVRISAALPGDLPAILDLLRRSKLPTEGLEPHIETAVVARLEGRVIGCAAVELYGSAALLRSVAVDVRHRGEGLGHDLTRAALTVARQRGASTVYLLTETAAEFFPQFGFQPVAREAVEPTVRGSLEFTTVCPTTAAVLKKDLSGTVL